MSDKSYYFLTRLVRMCKHNPANISFLKEAIQKVSLEKIAPLAIQVASETGDPIGKILAGSLAASESFNSWTDLYELLPDNTVSLREVRLIVVKRMLETARQHKEIDWRTIAEITAVFASCLNDMSDRSEALQYAQESACLYLRHSKTLSLRQILSFQVYAESLMAVGDMVNAILVQKFVVEDFEKIESSPKENQIHQLANSLLVLSSYYKIIEQFKQAINYGEKALAMTKAYADTSNEFAYLYHQIVRNLADCYEHTDHLKEAKEILSDNLKIISDLVGSSADKYQLALIDTLEIMATLESRLENKEMAKSHATEAIVLFEDYYQQRKKSLAASYVSLLNNMSLIDMSFNEIDNAADKLNKAESIIKPLYSIYPERFSEAYAAVLTNRVEVYLALHQHDEALHDAHKTLCLYRKVKLQQPPNINIEHDANIAMALNTLANVRMIDQDAFRAFRSINTCINLYRRLVEEDSYYLHDLATTLGTLAVIEERGENFHSALDVANEAILYWELCNSRLRQLHPKSFFLSGMTKLSCLVETGEYDQAEKWSESLMNFAFLNELIDDGKIGQLLALRANLYSCSEQSKKAINNAQEACNIYRVMPIDQIPSDKLNLAEALTNLCFMQSSENKEEAFQTIQEAVQLYSELPEPFTIDMTVNLAMALLNQGSLAHECGKDLMAIESLKDAYYYQQQIIDLLKGYPEVEHLNEDLLNILQTLLNVEYQVGDSGFFNTLKNIKKFLTEYVRDTNELKSIMQKLGQMKESFTQTPKDNVE